MGNQRMHQRTSIVARVEVLWVDSAGAQHTAAAMLEDRSLGGVCVRLSESIGVGSKVTIKWHREHFIGTVKHCKSVAYDYLVGIERDAANDAGGPV